MSFFAKRKLEWNQITYTSIEWMNEYTAVQIQSGPKLNSKPTLRMVKDIPLENKKVGVVEPS